jgi:ABC-type Zn2+ transport system substrate-binding protein/surface adhesin
MMGSIVHDDDDDGDDDDDDDEEEEEEEDDDGDYPVVDHKGSRQRPRSAPTWNDRQIHRRTSGSPTRRIFTPASIAQAIHFQEPARKASPPSKYIENGEDYTYDLNGTQTDPTE